MFSSVQQQQMLNIKINEYSKVSNQNNEIYKTTLYIFLKITTSKELTSNKITKTIQDLNEKIQIFKLTFGKLTQILISIFKKTISKIRKVQILRKEKKSSKIFNFILKSKKLKPALKNLKNKSKKVKLNFHNLKLLQNY